MNDWTNALKMQLSNIVQLLLKFAWISMVMFGFVGEGGLVENNWILWSGLLGMLVDALFLFWVTATQKMSAARIRDGEVSAPPTAVAPGTNVLVPPATPGATGVAVVTSGGGLVPA